jgi:hypothetical protein
MTVEERIERFKPKNCPTCGGEDVRFILGGRPTSEGYRLIEEGKAVLGTCFATRDRPDWRCVACRHEWFLEDDPCRKEMIELIGSIFGDKEH